MLQEPDPLVYLNGRFVSKADAALPVEDRGGLFGDGVYEVVRYYQGTAFAMDAHVARLSRSLAGIEMALPEDAPSLAEISDELVRRNGTPEAIVYWHLTRGVDVRGHALPDPPPAPTVLLMSYPKAPLDRADPVPTCSAITAEDERWGRCWIKSLNLLPNCLAKTLAQRAGCKEAILHRGDTVTEGTSSTALIVVDGKLVVRPEDRWVLPGVTRNVLVDLAGGLGLAMTEQTFTVEQMRSASEVLLCGTTTHVTAVTALDGRRIGEGEAGPITGALHRAFVARVLGG